MVNNAVFLPESAEPPDTVVLLIHNVFSYCCGSRYVSYIKENDVIEFKESKAVFDAEITSVEDNYITVKVISDSESFRIDDLVTMKANGDYEVGSKVRITFNGLVETSNPAQISIIRIELID